MRTARDRLRHAVLFELIALVIVAPVGGLIFNIPIGHFGVVAGVSTTIAMIWNYVYNLGFDLALVRSTGGARKTLPIRLAHATLFEGGLLALLVPFIAWFLDVSIWQAFMMDIGLAGFYLLYAFIYNLAYDLLFPAPTEKLSA